jgi:amidohydrolase
MSRSVITDDRLYATFKLVARELLGEDNVVELDAPSMGSEDFGMYLDHAPGLIFRVGMGADHPGLHHADFDFADGALRTGILVLCGMIARICGKGLDE